MPRRPWHSASRAAPPAAIARRMLARQSASPHERHEATGAVGVCRVHAAERRPQRLLVLHAALRDTERARGERRPREDCVRRDRRAERAEQRREHEWVSNERVRSVDEEARGRSYGVDEAVERRERATRPEPQRQTGEVDRDADEPTPRLDRSRLGSGAEERHGEQQLRERDVERDDDADERDPALLRRRRRGELRRHVFAAIATYEEPTGREDEEGRGAGDHVAPLAAARSEVRGAVTIAAARPRDAVARQARPTRIQNVSATRSTRPRARRRPPRVKMPTCVASRAPSAADTGTTRATPMPKELRSSSESGIARPKTANSAASSSSCTHSIASERPIPAGTRRGCASTRSWSAASARRSSASGRSSTR